MSQDRVIYGEFLIFSKEEDEYLNSLDKPENDRKYAKELFEKCFTAAYFQAKLEEGCDIPTTVKCIQTTNEYFVANRNWL